MTKMGPLGVGAGKKLSTSNDVALAANSPLDPTPLVLSTTVLDAEQVIVGPRFGKLLWSIEASLVWFGLVGALLDRQYISNRPGSAKSAGRTGKKPLSKIIIGIITANWLKILLFEDWHVFWNYQPIKVRCLAISW
jgi:hypothetical protein